MIYAVTLFVFLSIASFAVVLEPSLLRYDFNVYKKLEPCSPPYNVIYKNKLKELQFVAAFHGVGVYSSTFQMIKKTVDLFQPEVVIVEGIHSSLGMDAPCLIKIAKTQFSQDFQSCGESIYSIYLAHSNNFSFIGGEPDEEEIVRGCVKWGYTLQDILGFYLVRQVPQWRREGKLEVSFDSLAEEFISVYQERLNLTQYTKDIFYDWYIEKTGCFFNLKNVSEESSMPLESGTFLQKISAKITMLRDEHLQKVIEQNINRFDRVLVVYGRAHHIIHRGALEEYFGSGKFVK